MVASMHALCIPTVHHALCSAHVMQHGHSMQSMTLHNDMREADMPSLTQTRYKPEAAGMMHLLAWEIRRQI